jgi:hypothetical protein
VFGWDQSFGPISASDPLVAQSASGMLNGLAWHCYFGSPDYMSGVHAAAPNSQQRTRRPRTGFDRPLEASGELWLPHE